MALTFDSAALQEGLRIARIACIGELLSDPQPCDGDQAYDQAVRDCVSAIEKLMKIQVAPSDQDATEIVQGNTPC